MTYYNLSFIDNTTGVTVLWTGVNDQSGGWFAGLLLLSLYVLIFMVFMGSGYSFKDVFLGNNFLMSLIAGLLWGSGMVDEYVLGMAVALLAISLFIKIWSDG